LENKHIQTLKLKTMKNLPFICLLLFFQIKFLSAQSIFTKVFNDNKDITVKDAVSLKNGDVLIAAQIEYSGGDNDYFLVRIDTATGNVIWQSSEGNNDFHTVNKVSASALDAGFIVSGQLGDFGYVARFDASNNLVFEKDIEFFSGQTCNIFDALETGTNTFRFTGSSFDNTFSVLSIPYIKISESGGNYQFLSADQKSIYFNDVNPLSISGKKLINGGNNHYLQLGDISLSSSRRGIFISRINLSPSTSFGYVKQILGPISGSQLVSNDIATLNNGSNIAITANIPYAVLPNVAGKGVLLYFDNTGNVIWAKQMFDCIFNKAFMNTDNSVTVLGYSLGTTFLAKFNAAGNLMWQKNYADSADYTTFVSLDNGALMLVGQKFQTLTDKDISIAIVDSNGIGACLFDTTSLIVSDFIYTSSDILFDFGSQGVNAANVVYGGGTSYNPTITDQCFTVGIEEENEIHMMLYPNPVNKQLFINADQLVANSIKNIRVVDLNGKILHQQSDIGDGVINTSLFSQGVYLLEVITNDKALRTKFIKADY
jgi:hypothetical protein